MLSHINTSLKEAHAALENLLANEETLNNIEQAAGILIHALESDHRVFSCGNGGSMCDAMHFAEELTGRYRKNRKAYPAISISDASHISCVANDYGYEYIFSRYVESHGRLGDVVVALSTSGSSPNIHRVAQSAKAQNMKVIVLAGKVNKDLQQYTDAYICTPGGEYADRVQELHIKVLHIFIEMIERHFHPENYD